MKRMQRGFTLVEILIVIAIIGIISAVAIPNYSQYVMRTRLTTGFSALSTMELAAEQFWANGRTYEGLDASTARLMPANTNTFDYTAADLTATTYTVIATGKNQAAGFKYSINEKGERKTLAVPDEGGWVAKDSCWVDRKGGECTQ